MKYALYNNKKNKFVKLLATRMLSHDTIYELTSDVEEVKELTDKPYTDAELRHFEDVAGVEKGSFENYKLSMQDEQAYTVYSAREKSLQAIHDYLCMLDPRNVDSIANFVDQIQIAIYNITDFDMEEYFADKDYYLDDLRGENDWDDEDDYLDSLRSEDDWDDEDDE